MASKNKSKAAYTALLQSFGVAKDWHEAPCPVVQRRLMRHSDETYKKEFNLDFRELAKRSIEKSREQSQTVLLDDARKQLASSNGEVIFQAIAPVLAGMQLCYRNLEHKDFKQPAFDIAPILRDAPDKEAIFSKLHYVLFDIRQPDDTINWHIGMHQNAVFTYAARKQHFVQANPLEKEEKKQLLYDWVGRAITAGCEEYHHAFQQEHKPTAQRIHEERTAYYGTSNYIDKQKTLIPKMVQAKKESPEEFDRLDRIMHEDPMEKDTAKFIAKLKPQIEAMAHAYTEHLITRGKTR